MGAFEHFNWNNVFVAGGSVLHCLRQMKNMSADEDLQEAFETFYDWSDIDMYIYGLDEAETKKKVPKKEI
jgi:aromatic ring-opening dioxygenase catalytic subunit (LigB family)